MRLFFIFVLLIVFISCKNESIQEKPQFSQENKVQAEKNNTQIFSVDFFKQIFSTDIKHVESFLKEKGCKNISKRQYGNTDEWYLECDINKNSIVVMFNGRNGTIVQVDLIPDKPVKTVEKFLNIEALVKEGFILEKEGNFDNKDLYSRIIVKPKDFEERYTTMIEGN